MPDPLEPAVRAQFGPFLADFRAGELFKNGRKIRLQGQPLQVLALLIENPGEVVTREHLRQKLWQEDTFVDFDHGLNSAINRLREALNDSAEEPRFIETLPRRGYRFIAEVQIDAKPAPQSGPLHSPIEPKAQLNTAGRKGTATAQNVPGQAPPKTTFQRPAARYSRYVAVAVLALGLVFTSVVIGGWRTLPFVRPAVPHIESLVVLPLTNLSHDPGQDYFADGMTEAVIANLAQVRALRVISRTSAMHYKGTNKTLPEIARELNVDAVVEGVVQRSSNRIRVTAQLINGKTDAHLWAKTFERDSQDVLVMQSEVARAIANEINVRLTPQEHQQLANARPVNPDAYNAYLLGNFHAAKRNPAAMAKAIDYFQQAIRLDPNYAQAYAALANGYFDQEIWGGVGIGSMENQVCVSTLKAIALDQDLAEAHLLLAQIHFRYDWDWERAEAEFKRAIELNSNFPAAFDTYAYFLQAMGRQQEALAAAHHAVELDPLSAWSLSTEGRILFRAHQYESAVTRYQRALELDPAYIPALTRMANVYTAMGKYDQALAYINRLRQVAGDNSAGSIPLLELYARTGKRREALAGLTARYRDGALDHDVLGVACIYAALGDHDRAIATLEKGLEARSAPPWIFADPRLDPLRSDPRFQQILRRINLPS